MSTQQLHLFNASYLVVLVVVAVLTRAPARCIAGTLAGRTSFGVAALGIIALGEAEGWWHMNIRWEPYSLALLVLNLSFCSCRLQAGRTYRKINAAPEAGTVGARQTRRTPSPARATVSADRQVACHCVVD